MEVSTRWGIVNRQLSIVHCWLSVVRGQLLLRGEFYGQSTIDHGRWRAMSMQAPKAVPSRVSKSVRVAVAAARFNADIVDELLAGCLRRLGKLGVGDSRVDVVRVPGAFELPVTAAALARSGRYGAVVCLGAVIRGDTPHFDYVAGEAARGIQDVAVQTGVPVIFGVLTTNTQEQAVERIGGKHGHAGERAAEAAVEMIGVLAGIGRGKRPASARTRW
jgi:6,7-dimethyl-8-ribityllumazine synthase